MVQTMRRAAAIVAALVVLGSVTVGLRAAGAQEEAVAHPAHIHEGTCAVLGDVAYVLSDVVPAAPAAGSPAAMGAPTAIPVEMSVTTVNAKLADLLAAPYAINIHQSGKAIEDYIACGDIGGQVVGADLMIGLRLLGTYGYAGIAVLHADGDTTTVTVYLAERLAPAAGASTVVMTESEMTITASQTTFRVGQPYTFVVTNVGTTEHELVIEHRGDVDKPMEVNGQESEAPNIAPGQTKTLTWTFTEPGEYQFACHLPEHYQAGMVLPIEVTA
jgi:uncharacterized cupredoxin-like copper-binding protein